MDQNYDKLPEHRPWDEYQCHMGHTSKEMETNGISVDRGHLKTPSAGRKHSHQAPFLATN